jgi:hypothetical protein
MSVSADDFYNLLAMAITNEEEEKEETCLITKEPLELNHVILECGHKYNYDAIYNEYKKQVEKYKSCPYCRKVQTKPLPVNDKYAPIIMGQQPVYTHFYGSCEWVLKTGPNKGKKCGKWSKQQKFNKPYCATHAPKITEDAGQTSKPADKDPKSKPIVKPVVENTIVELSENTIIQSGQATPIKKKKDKPPKIIYYTHVDFLLNQFLFNKGKHPLTHKLIHINVGEKYTEHIWQFDDKTELKFDTKDGVDYMMIPLKDTDNLKYEIIKKEGKISKVKMTIHVDDAKNSMMVKVNKKTH